VHLALASRGGRRSLGHDEDIVLQFAANIGIVADDLGQGRIPHAVALVRGQMGFPPEPVAIS